MSMPEAASTLEPAEALAALADRQTLARHKTTLGAMPRRLGRVRLRPADRAALGVTSTGGQLRRSLACLQLLQARPELAAALPAGMAEAWEEVVGARLLLAQLRRCLEPVRAGAERAELLLRAAITQDNDAIEDHAAARAAGAPPEVARRLRAKFEDPGRLRELFQENAAARARRRGQREAVRAQARTEGWRLVARELGVQRLQQEAPPAGMRPDERRRTR